MFVITIFIICGVLSAIIWVWSDTQNNKRIDTYKALAERVRGEFIQGNASHSHILRATVRDVFVTLDHCITGSGRNTQKWDRVSASLPPNLSGRALEIYAQKGLLMTLSKSLGGQDVEVGHRQFDETFIVKTNHEPWLKKHLTREAIVLHLRAPECSVQITSEKLTIYRKHKRAELDELVEMLHLTAEYRRALAPELIPQKGAQEPSPSTKRAQLNPQDIW